MHYHNVCGFKLTKENSVSLTKCLAAGVALIASSAAFAGPALHFKLTTSANHVFHPVCKDVTQNKNLGSVDVTKNSPPLPWGMFYLLGAHPNDEINCTFIDEAKVTAATADLTFKGNTGVVNSASLTAEGATKYSLAVSAALPAEGDVTVTIGDA